MNANDLIAEFIKLDDWIEAESKRFAEHLKPTKQRMEEIKALLLTELNKQAGSAKASISTDAGTAYRSTIVSPKIEDRDKYLDTVLENWDEFGNAMLQLMAPNKEAIADYQQANDGKLPPGVKFSEPFIKVNIRRS